MPASSTDLVTVSLQNSSEKESKGCCGNLNSGLQDQLHVSTKQILVQEPSYENSWPSSSYALSTFTKGCCPISKKAKTQTAINNKHLKKGSKDSSKMACNKSEDKLEEPRVILWSPDKVVLGWRKTFPPGAGMVNLGNTCYMNSSLQALFHIPSLGNWLLEELNTHIPNCETNPQSSSFCSICAMMKTLKQSLDCGTNVCKPFQIHNKLKCIGKTLLYGRQEDAHEFIKLLLDHMEKSFLQFKRAIKLDHRSKETTPLNQIFGGYLRQQVICPLCCYVSTTFSHFQDLVLDIRSVNSVDEALNLYFKKETLDSDNAYKCEKCHKKVPATKRHLIEKAPHVLLLQLKRFTISGGKITKHVNIQKNIDISRYVNGVKPSNPNGTGPYFYKLVSMVIHIGSSQHGGHYTAVAEASNNTMFEFDDSSVRPISVQSALLKNPYILFYEMVRKPKSNSMPKQVIRQSSEKALIRQTSSDKFSKPLPTSLSTNCMWNGVNNSHAVVDDVGEAVSRNGIINSKKSPLLPQKDREKISFGIKSHSTFNKGLDEGKYSKQNPLGSLNGAIVKRPFQSSSSSLTKSQSNGKNYITSGLVPYNDESESDEEEEINKDSNKLINGHAYVHEKSLKSLKSNDLSESCKNINGSNKFNNQNNLVKSKINLEKLSGADKHKSDKIKNEKVMNGSSSQGNIIVNGTSFLPRSVQIQSSGCSKDSVVNKTNIARVINRHSMNNDPVNSKTINGHETNKGSKVLVKNDQLDSSIGNSTNKPKKENSFACSDDELSPADSNNSSSSPFQGFGVTDKVHSKLKSDKILKERESFNGWTNSSNGHKLELEKSFSQDSILNSKSQHNDRSETASVKSKESLDSNRSDKSSRSVKKSLFSLFPCMSSTQSPDFSPEEEQMNSVIENKTVSPVRTDLKRLPTSSTSNSNQNFVQKPEATCDEKCDGPEENEEEEETDDEDDDDGFHLKEDKLFDLKPLSSSSKISQIERNLCVASDKEINIAERSYNGENSEEKTSKLKPTKSLQTVTHTLVKHFACDENKKERNFSTPDEENFSMEEKKSRHKKKHKIKIIGEETDSSFENSCKSKGNSDSSIVTYNWNRHLKDLSDTLCSSKKNFDKNKSVDIIQNGSWNGSSDLSVVNALKKAGSLPFGQEVKTWEGEECQLDKEIRRERIQAKKRFADEIYNEEYDRGKVRKKRFKNFHSDSYRRENPFQKFQNEFINKNGSNVNNFNNLSKDKNTFHNNHFRSNSYNNNINGGSTSNGTNNSSYSKNTSTHSFGFNGRNFNDNNVNVGGTSNNTNNSHGFRSQSWDLHNSQFPQQNHFRLGANKFNRNKSHWFKNHRNGRGKYGRKRDFRDLRH